MQSKHCLTKTGSLNLETQMFKCLDRFWIPKGTSTPKLEQLVENQCPSTCPKYLSVQTQLSSKRNLAVFLWRVLYWIRKERSCLLGIRILLIFTYCAGKVAGIMSELNWNIENRWQRSNKKACVLEKGNKFNDQFSDLKSTESQRDAISFGIKTS